MTKVAFIGLGNMGAPMAANLVKAGHAVSGFDLVEAAKTAAEGTGVTIAPSAREAVRDAEVVVTMLPAGRHVLAAHAEFLDAAPKGALVIDCSTIDVDSAKRAHAAGGAAGMLTLDAPVSGGVGGATAGTLTVMVGASTPVFAAARPVLDVLGGKVVHVGERPGQGAVVKTINQLLCGVHIAAAAEALALAEKVGVDRAVLLDVVGGSAASSWMLKDRGPRMLQADPVVASAVDIFVKDLGIVMEAGRDSKAALPLAALAHQMFLAASGQGAGKADDSQVIRAYAALNGM